MPVGTPPPSPPAQITSSVPLAPPSIGQGTFLVRSLVDSAGSYSVAHRAGLLPTQPIGMWGWILLRFPHQGRRSPLAPAPTKQRPWGVGPLPCRQLNFSAWGRGGRGGQRRCRRLPAIGGSKHSVESQRNTHVVPNKTECQRSGKGRALDGQGHGAIHRGLRLGRSSLVRGAV